MKRFIPLIAGLLVVMIAATAIFLTFFTREQTTEVPTEPVESVSGTNIRLTVAPSFKVSITMNGKGVKEGVIAVKPGQYTVVASRDGFETVTRTVVVQQDKTTDVGIVLPVTDSTVNYYKDNPNEARKVEGISSRQSSERADSKVEALPFLARLPVRVPGEYTISYGPSVSKPEDTAAVTIYIAYSTPAAMEAAKNWIRYQGYDPASLDIKYTANRAQ